MGIFSKLFKGLAKTKDAIAKNMGYLFSKNELDEEFFEELEYVLISADFSHETATEVTEEMRERA